MSLEWSNLPNEILSNIFETIPVRDLKRISLVCSKWSEEIAFSWSSRILLYTSRLQTDDDLESLKLSNRYYENLLVEADMDVEHFRAIYKCLKGRKLQYTNKVKSVKLSGDLAGVLNELENEKLEKVSLKFDWNEANSFDPISFKCLQSVKDLTIGNVPANFKDFFKANFRNLKSLDFSLYNSIDYFNRIEALKTLVEGSCDSLERFSVDCNFGDNSAPFEFLRNVNSLSHFTFKSFLSQSTLHKTLLESQRDVKSINLINTKLTDTEIQLMSSNFRNLNKLDILLHVETPNLTEIGLGNLWKMKQLEYLGLGNFKIPKRMWDTYCFNSKNFNLTTLVISGITIDDAFVDKCVQNVPNLETFKLTFMKETILSLKSFNSISRLSKLRSLLIWQVQIIKGMDPEIAVLENLQNLSLIALKKIPQEFFDNFIAPAMTHYSLEDCSSRTGDPHVVLEAIGAVVKNCPSIEHLNIRSNHVIPNKAVHVICSKLENLREVCFADFSVDSTLHLLENVKSLTYANITLPRTATADEIIEGINSVSKKNNIPLSIRHYTSYENQYKIFLGCVEIDLYVLRTNVNFSV